ncbi:hypothetical protein CYY_007314 [Polysphondylium violaceum]|uniref:RING-type domain-containing protein n=1 Tax=Polysphondylium violaceum TaxID=133409 RepID=A0A8J4PS23_9MYCE|nr:hypothetical protein CYY_007314 [Polysphondylium violaceum]
MMIFIYLIIIFAFSISGSLCNGIIDSKQLQTHIKERESFSTSSSSSSSSPNSNNNNNSFQDICSSPLTLDNYQYDLSSLENKIFEYSNIYNSTFFINLCLKNTTSPCPDDVVCEIHDFPNRTKEIYDLAIPSTLLYVSNGMVGLDLYYTGGYCENDQYFNTTISLVCDQNEEGNLIITSKHCAQSIIIKTKYCCPNQTKPGLSLMTIFVILFGCILVLILLFGLGYSCRERLKRCCCNCLGSNQNEYIPINQNININGDIENNNNNQNNSNNNNNSYQNSNSNNNNNNNNSNNSNSSSSNNNNQLLYDHEILQGSTPTQESNYCSICFENIINTVLIECGHSAVCLGCTKKIKECPICRKNILKVVQIYPV